jgi:hypothetical protein
MKIYLKNFTLSQFNKKFIKMSRWLKKYRQLILNKPVSHLQGGMDFDSG